MIKNNEVVDQWVKLNKVMNLYKISSLCLSIVVLGFFVLVVVLLNKDTIVVAVNGNEKVFLEGNRTKVEVTENDVLNTAKKFAEIRYKLNQESIKSLERNLSPIVSEGLLKKISASLNSKRDENLEKIMEQDLIIKKAEITDDGVYLLIHRVITFQGRAGVVSPVELSLGIVKGDANEYNPFGLYVHTIVEHELQ